MLLSDSGATATEASATTLIRQRSAAADSICTQQVLAGTSQQKRRCGRFRSPIDFRLPFLSGSSSVIAPLLTRRQTSHSKSSGSLSNQKIVESVVFKPSTVTSSLRLLERRQRVALHNDDDNNLVITGSSSTDDVITAVCDQRETQPSSPVRRSLSQGQRVPLGCHIPAASSQYRSMSHRVWSETSNSSSSLVDATIAPTSPSVACDSSPARPSFAAAESFDLPYSTESYLCHRTVSTRRGFGGNYNRRLTTTINHTLTLSAQSTTSSSVLDVSLSAAAPSSALTPINHGILDDLSPSTSQSMPGTLRRQRAHHQRQPLWNALPDDRSLLIYLEGRLSAKTKVSESVAVDVEEQSTKIEPPSASDSGSSVVANIANSESSDRRDASPVSHVTNVRDTALETRWTSVVASIETRRRQQRRAGSIFESAAARGASSPDIDFRLTVPDYSSPRSGGSTNQKCRSKAKARAKSEGSLDLITATLNGASSASTLRTSSSPHHQNRRMSAELRRRRSWECEVTLTLEADCEYDRKSLSRRKPTQSVTSPTVSDVGSGNDPRKTDSFDSGIDTKTGSLHTIRNVVLHITDEQSDDVIGDVDQSGTSVSDNSTSIINQSTVECRPVRTEAALTMAEHEYEVWASKLVALLQRSRFSSEVYHRRGRLADDEADNIRDAEQVVDIVTTPRSLRRRCDVIRRRNETEVLCRVLQPRPNTSPVEYMNGLLDDVERNVTKACCPLDTAQQTDAPPTSDDVLPVNDPSYCRRLEETVLRMLQAKMHTLHDEKTKFEMTKAEADDLSSQVSQMLADRLPDKQVSRYRMYVHELRKVIRLMLLLAVRWSRVENEISVSQLSENDQEIQRALMLKRDEISERFKEAFNIKSDLDERFKRLDRHLRDVLDETEMGIYTRSIRLLVQTRLDAQWIEDRIEVGTRQLAIFDVDSLTEQTHSILVREKYED